MTVQAAGPTQIRVLWSGVPNAEKYIVYRSAAPGQNLSTTRVYKGVNAGQTSLLDTGLVPGTIYNYEIQARTGTLYSPMSRIVPLMTPLAATPLGQSPPASAPAPVTVTLAASPAGRDLQVAVSFLNTSFQPVYLNNVSACLDGKIGDSVFYVTTEGQQVPFVGRKTSRPSSPGPRQFTVLPAGETKRVTVNLGRSYRLLPGTHTYTVTYSAVHTYPGRFKLLLNSVPVSCTVSR